MEGDTQDARTLPKGSHCLPSNRESTTLEMWVLSGYRQRHAHDQYIKAMGDERSWPGLIARVAAKNRSKFKLGRWFFCPVTFASWAVMSCNDCDKLWYCGRILLEHTNDMETFWGIVLQRHLWIVEWSDTHLHVAGMDNLWGWTLIGWNMTEAGNIRFIVCSVECASMLKH